MKVLFINREDALTVNGGDTVQMLNTKEELELLGVDVEVCLGKSDEEQYDNFDLIHIFNMQTDKFTLQEIEKINKKGKKIILSPIWWNFEKTNIEDVSNFSETAIKISKIIGKKNIIILKKIKLKLRYNRMKKILNYSHVILPNSEMEKKLLIDEFNIAEEKFEVVFNGISDKFLTENNKNSERKYALQVGRIESEKNTHLSIKACKELNIPLLIIGKNVDEEYYELCLNEAKNSNVSFLGIKNHDELIELYKESRIHILPSKRETPGLVSLEAASQGCNIVSTNVGSARDYFKELAYYCDPSDYNSIRNAIKKAWKTDTNNNLDGLIKQKFTWKIAAEQTLSGYNKAIKKN